MRLFSRLVVVMACVAFTSTVRADFIVNGDFETGDFTGWTLSGNTTDPTTFGVDSSFPASGSYAAYFGPQGSEAFLTQVVTTTPGLTYQLDFDLMNEDGSSPNEFSVAFGSTVLSDTTNLATFSYQTMSYTVVATSSSTAVTFGFRNDFAFFDLDNVSLRAVPEPGSLGCLAIGLGLTVLHGWKRRSTRATAKGRA